MIDKGKSLAYNFPELAKEWDYEKNTPLTPFDVSYGSTKKVYWKCPTCQNSYPASVNQKTNHHSGCPYCSNHKLMPGMNDLATKHPTLAEEWDYIENRELHPSDVMCSSHKLVSWVCKDCGNTYKAWVFNRTKGEGCPYCSGRKVITGFNDFASQCSHLLEEWDFEANSTVHPHEITSRSNRRVGWICSVCGHKWKTPIVRRTMGSQCPKCNKRNHTSFPEQAIFYYIKKVFPDSINGFSDIFKTSMELDVYIPSLKTGIEYDGIQWHTDKQEQREKAKYEICQTHGIRLLRVREDGSSNENCDVAITSEYRYRDYFKLDETIRRVFVELNAEPPNIDTDRDSVEINSNFLVLLKKESFGECFPQYIKEWDKEKNGQLTPYMFLPFSNEKVSWICNKCGHKYDMTISSKAQGRKCIKCSYALRGEKLSKRNQKKVRNLDTDIVFESVADAAVYYGGDPKKNHIGECCNGKLKTALGYRWEYV